MKPQKRILRYAAILLVAIFAASVIVPVPQASAWRIWWLDLITKNSDVDMKVDTEKEYDFVEYYPGEIPEGFELVKDESVEETSRVIEYVKDDSTYIRFKQQKKEKSNTFLDSENSDIEREQIGDFETIVTLKNDVYLFEFATEFSINYVQTNAGHAIGREFIENLIKK